MGLGVDWTRRVACRGAMPVASLFLEEKEQLEVGRKGKRKKPRCFLSSFFCGEDESNLFIENLRKSAPMKEGDVVRRQKASVARGTQNHGRIVIL